MRHLNLLDSGGVTAGVELFPWCKVVGFAVKFLDLCVIQKVPFCCVAVVIVS